MPNEDNETHVNTIRSQYIVYSCPKDNLSKSLLTFFKLCKQVRLFLEGIDIISVDFDARNVNKQVKK